MVYNREMITPDFINGAFELCATFFILNHARAVWKTRQADGVSIISTIFFACWGCWNVWYYPHLGQMLSFYAGIAVLCANFFWIYSIWYIRKQNKLTS